MSPPRRIVLDDPTTSQRQQDLAYGLLAGPRPAQPSHHFAGLLPVPYGPKDLHYPVRQLS